MILYLITGPTGKQYAGQTVQTLQQRWSDHRSRARCGAPGHLYNAIRKHGEGAFVLEAIGEAGTEEELNRMEVREIRERGLMDRELGYNMSEGGGGTSGRECSEETKQKISAAKSGRTFGPLSAEHKRKVGDYHRGRKRSPEARAAMSRARLGRTYAPHSDKHKMRMRSAWIKRRMKTHFQEKLNTRRLDV